MIVAPCDHEFRARTLERIELAPKDAGALLRPPGRKAPPRAVDGVVPRVGLAAGMQHLAADTVRALSPAHRASAPLMELLSSTEGQSCLRLFT